MRKLLPTMAVLAFITLPGCIFALGGESMRHEHRTKMSSLEKRVSMLEKHELGKCGENCKFCAEE
jgi:hypothetical protein